MFFQTPTMSAPVKILGELEKLRIKTTSKIKWIGKSVRRSSHSGGRLATTLVAIINVKIFHFFFFDRTFSFRRSGRQYFTLGAKIHQIEIWNIDSKKYSETVISEHFGILISNSDRGTNLSHLSDSVYSRIEYHTHLM